MNKKRILFVHHGLGISGAAVSLSNIIDSLDRDRYEPVVLMRDSPAVALFESCGVTVHITRNLPSFRHTTAGGYAVLGPRLWLTLTRNSLSAGHWQKVLAEFQPDLVHLNSITLLPLCRPARMAGAKVVVHVRETVLEGTWGVRKRWISNHLSQNADAVIHISDYDRLFLQCHAPIVEVIPNWVDLEQFDRTISGDKIRQELGLSAEQNLVVTLVGATKIKDTIHLVRAMELLSARRDLVLGIIGLAPPATYPTLSVPKRLAKRLLGIDVREQIFAFVQEHKLAERIHFLGVRRDIPAVLAACNMLVFPATRAHQARPVFEAGAMAKPVIATDFDCIHEDVVHGSNGLLVPANDPAALANAIVELNDDPLRSQAMGEANYVRTVERHNARINASKVTMLFDSLV